MLLARADVGVFAAEAVAVKPAPAVATSFTVARAEDRRARVTQVAEDQYVVRTSLTWMLPVLGENRRDEQAASARAHIL